MKIRAVLCAALLLGASVAVRAQTANSGLLGGFNVVTQGNFTSTADSEGPVLIGGNLSGSATIMNLGAAPAGYGSVNVVGNTAGATYNTNGLAVKVGTANQGATFSGASSVLYNATWSTPFSSTWTQLASLSASLALLTTTSGSGLSGGTFTAGPATVNGASNIAVLNITSAQLAAVGNPTMSLGTAKLFVINVDTSGSAGAYNPAGGTNFNGQAYAGSVLWNFYNATSLGFGVEFGGSILAPGAAVTNASPIDGALVAKSFNGTGEIHYKPLNVSALAFTDTVATKAPEPASLALLAIALPALAAVRRRR